MKEEICKSISPGSHRCELLEGHKGNHRAYDGPGGTNVVADWWTEESEFSSLKSELEKAKAEAARYREGLEFYANEDNWAVRSCEHTDTPCIDEEIHPVDHKEPWITAQAALKEAK